MYLSGSQIPNYGRRCNSWIAKAIFKSNLQAGSNFRKMDFSKGTCQDQQCSMRKKYVLSSGKCKRVQRSQTLLNDIKPLTWCSLHLLEELLKSHSSSMSRQRECAKKTSLQEASLRSSQDLTIRGKDGSASGMNPSASSLII